jgi:hypothetical protein
MRHAIGEKKMSRITGNFWRRGRMLALATGVGFGLVGVFVPGLTGAAPGDENPIIRVEQDWEMQLSEPVSDLDVPQFHTVMSPYASTNATYFQVTWNYREMPSFMSGGLQLQVWNGSESFAVRNVDSGSLSSDAESVAWTQSLYLEGSDLTFSVTNGRSSSWGEFGGESMTVRMASPVLSLNAYDTEVSAANSWITYGKNRVMLMVLRQVREYDANGLRSIDVTPRVIYHYSGE